MFVMMIITVRIWWYYFRCFFYDVRCDSYREKSKKKVLLAITEQSMLIHDKAVPKRSHNTNILGTKRESNFHILRGEAVRRTEWVSAGWPSICFPSTFLYRLRVWCNRTYCISKQPFGQIPVYWLFSYYLSIGGGISAFLVLNQ